MIGQGNPVLAVVRYELPPARPKVDRATRAAATVARWLRATVLLSVYCDGQHTGHLTGIDRSLIDGAERQVRLAERQRQLGNTTAGRPILDRREIRLLVHVLGFQLIYNGEVDEVDLANSVEGWTAATGQLADAALVLHRLDRINHPDTYTPEGTNP